MATHVLKSDPLPFIDVVMRGKRCEIRKDDRSYERGDNLVLRETTEDRVGFTGREVVAAVSHVQRDYGLMPGFVALSIIVIWVGY